MTNNLKWINVIRKSVPNALIFPILIGLIVIVLSFLKISGTSMGVYDYMFGAPTDNLIAGEPRTVRSDEWIVNTPFIIAQYQDGYPILNKDVGHGQDMSIALDVPYLDWSMVFKPQNLPFFIAPLTIAFAFKWWLLAAALAAGVYYFVLFLYPRRYLMASVIAIFFVFNPFIQWWYQSITLLAVAYGLLITVLVLRILEQRETRKTIVPTIGLTYLLICFALIMYPAFQVGVILVAIAVIISVLSSRNEFNLLIQKKILILAPLVIAITAIVVGFFLYQNIDAVKATLGTIYPGHRHVASGGFNPINLLTWPLSYLLLSKQNSFIFGNNQSEVSNFMLFGYATLPFLFHIWYRERGAFSKLEKYLIIGLSVLTTLIFWRMFIPFGDVFFELIGLGSVPHVRLFIALGVVNMILLTIAVGRKGEKLTSASQILNKSHIGVFSLTIAIYGLLITFLVHHFVIRTVGIFEGIFVTLILAVITTLLVSSIVRLRYVGLLIMTVFTIVSAGLVNPIYRGLAINSNSFTQYVKSQDKKDNGYWISNDEPYLSSAILASGAEVYGGVNTYPQTSIWKKYFPGQQSIYNRYAHVGFLINNSNIKRSLTLIQADSFRVNVSGCDPLLADLHIKHIVSDVDLGTNLACYPILNYRLFNLKPLYIYSY